MSDTPQPLIGRTSSYPLAQMIEDFPASGLSGPNPRASPDCMGDIVCDPESTKPTNTSSFNIVGLRVEGLDLEKHLLHPNRSASDLDAAPSDPRPSPAPNRPEAPPRRLSDAPPVHVRIAREKGDLQGFRNSDKTHTEGKLAKPSADQVYGGGVAGYAKWETMMPAEEEERVEGDTLSFGLGEGGVITRDTFDHNHIPTPASMSGPRASA